MRLLIIHNEAVFFAGAERMLGYYLEGLANGPSQVTVAVTNATKMRSVIPHTIEVLPIPDNQVFSVTGLASQVKALVKAHRRMQFSIIHGWTARTWELTSLLATWVRRPALGTLHDHPSARFISSKRQALMRHTARWGLRSVVCVSEAVRQACVDNGYPKTKLEVVHNGLPASMGPPRLHSNSPFTIGFLGAFSERKGLEGFFCILDLLARLTDSPWRAMLAGGAQDPSGEGLVQNIHDRYRRAAWWTRVQWEGWTDHVNTFLDKLDILICPSSEFDPFPTVLLEAGRRGVAVLAARSGGIPEIVCDGKTGWLFDPQNWSQAANRLAALLSNKLACEAAGVAAHKHINSEFSMDKMVANYQGLYSNLCANV